MVNPERYLSLQILEFKLHLHAQRLLNLWTLKQRKILIQLQNLEKFQKNLILLQVRTIKTELRWIYCLHKKQICPIITSVQIHETILPKKTAPNMMGTNIYPVMLSFYEATLTVRVCFLQETILPKNTFPKMIGTNIYHVTLSFYDATLTAHTYIFCKKQSCLRRQLQRWWVSSYILLRFHFMMQH